MLDKFPFYQDVSPPTRGGFEAIVGCSFPRGSFDPFPPLFLVFLSLCSAAEVCDLVLFPRNVFFSFVCMALRVAVNCA